MSTYNQDKLTEEVIGSFKNAPIRACKRDHDVARHAPARVRARGRPDDRGMARGPRLRQGGRPHLDRQARGVHRAVGHARPVDDDRVARAGARQRRGQGRAARDRGDRRRAVLLARARPTCRSAPTSAKACPATPALYTGRVTDVNGKPLAGALLDVWSGDGDGKYDVQLSDEPAMKARGRFRTDAEGRYWFWSIMPSYYPVPDDGPVGDDAARHRPQHQPPRPHAHDGLGRRATCRSRRTSSSPRARTSHEDAVFGKRDSLVVQFEKHEPGKAPDGRMMKTPYHSANYDFRLRAGRSHEDRQGHRPAHRDLHLRRAHHRGPRPRPRARADRQHRLRRPLLPAC